MLKLYTDDSPGLRVYVLLTSLCMETNSHTLAEILLLSWSFHFLSSVPSSSCTSRQKLFGHSPNNFSGNSFVRWFMTWGPLYMQAPRRLGVLIWLWPNLSLEWKSVQMGFSIDTWIHCSVRLCNKNHPSWGSHLNYLMPCLFSDGTLFFQCSQARTSGNFSRATHKRNLGIQTCGFSWLYEIRVSNKTIFESSPKLFSFLPITPF